MGGRDHNSKRSQRVIQRSDSLLLGRGMGLGFELKT
jgi:hypothetical protein